MSHKGRHATQYHLFMLDKLNNIDSIANGNVNIFLSKFNDLKQFIMKNLEMLRRSYWL